MEPLLSLGPEGMSAALSGKRVLIAQPFLHAFGGSELIALELAEALRSVGCSVDVVSWSVSDAWRERFRDVADAEVFEHDTDSFAARLVSAPPHLVWSHQGFIPERLVREPGSTRFVFAHLSSFHPYESPFSPELELSLADHIYIVSPEAAEELVDDGPLRGADPERVSILRNPAPEEFHAWPGSGLREADAELGNLLVVSNHFPEEVKQAIAELRDRGVLVKAVGVNQPGVDSAPERITAELLSQFDAVLSIGKTVQYALAMGIPVYCYDHFGGPGWIGQQTQRLAESKNYSGRGFDAKTSESIAEELVQGFSEAAAFTTSTRGEWRLRYSYAGVLQQLAKVLAAPTPDRQPVPLPVVRGYIDAHRAVQEFGRAYHQLNFLTAQHISNLEDIISAQSEEVESLKASRASQQKSGSHRICLRVVSRVRRALARLSARWFSGGA